MTIKELKETAEQLATARGISTQQAADIIRDYKGDPRELLAGSHGGENSTMGETSTGTAGATCSKKRRTKKEPQKENTENFMPSPTDFQNVRIPQTVVNQHATINRVTRAIAEDIRAGASIDCIESMEPGFSSQLLPDTLHDDIVAIIDGFANTHDIKDKYKIDPRQFGAICTLVGMTIKQRGLLRDRERERIEGGMRYDGERVTELLRLYAYICDEYRQIAFMFNFQKFSGVSYEFLKDYEERLTSSRAQLLKKCDDIQRASITASIASNTGNVVGNIFLGKALAGLQETVTVQHVTTATAPVSGSLPVFDTVAGGLIEQKGE